LGTPAKANDATATSGIMMDEKWRGDMVAFKSCVSGTKRDG
jgi:hypothetical protein